MKTRMLGSTLKLALLSAALIAPAAHSGTLARGFEDCRVATAEELGEMRGGFDLSAGGLHLSFSIERVTFINGELVATTSLGLPSLNSFGNPPTASSGSYNPVTLVQNGPNNNFTLPAGLNLSTTALATVVQNTLDNQTISNMTILNTTLNSQSLQRAMAVTSSLSQMLNSSVR